jgi:single-stranded-DNA-specific exonuclease
VADEPLGQALLQGQGQRFHLAGNLGADYWQGRKRMQLRVMDAAPV